MMIYFENELGRIEIGGGRHPTWNATAITGLGFPQKEFNVTRYGKSSGQKTQSSAYLARAITIAGDIRRETGAFEVAKAIRVFDLPGTLYIYGKINKKKIACYCSSFETEPQQGSHTTFTLQLTCDDPLFTDFIQTDVAVFRREDMIKGTFTFPMIFTVRTSEADILINGDCDVVPVFEIYNTAKEEASLSDRQGIEILNETTGQKIGIECTTTPGEVITVDIENREITSNVQGDLIGDITDDTYLDRFWLQKGHNHIKVINYNTGENIDVICRYYNRYLEALT